MEGDNTIDVLSIVFNNAIQIIQIDVRTLKFEFS